MDKSSVQIGPGTFINYDALSEEFVLEIVRGANMTKVVLPEALLVRLKGSALSERKRRVITDKTWSGGPSELRTNEEDMP